MRIAVSDTLYSLAEWLKGVRFSLERFLSGKELERAASTVERVTEYLVSFNFDRIDHEVIENIELLFLDRFAEAYRRFVRVDAIPEGLREKAREFIEIVKQLEWGATRSGFVYWSEAGTRVVSEDLVLSIVKDRGMPRDMVSSLINAGMAIRVATDKGSCPGIPTRVFVFPAPVLREDIPRGGSVEVPPQRAEASTQFAAGVSGRDLLEGVVADVLRELGFRVWVDVERPTRAGGRMEVDVWAEGASRVRVYVSCKNWKRNVDRRVVDEEVGRLANLRDQPHVKVLVVRGLNDQAREAALANGFLVVELGEKADVEDAAELRRLVKERLAETLCFCRRAEGLAGF